MFFKKFKMVWFGEDNLVYCLEYLFGKYGIEDFMIYLFLLFKIV